MFTPQFFIAAIQGVKKNVISQVLQDKKLAEVANRYVDTQTEFANMLVQNTIDVARYSYDKLTSCGFANKNDTASKAPYKVEKEAL